ncbi:SdiA-regulated domain-containing protein [Myxococcota bacterium]|nr:SdiA-regulated domain-containing protein [Myxococcota bacterium]
MIGILLLADAQQASAGATLVRRFDTYTPKGLHAEDPSGIAFLPESGGFYLVDADINGSPRFEQKNMWSTSFDGNNFNLKKAIDLTRFTSEPTGVLFHPNRKTLFVTDDDSLQVYEIDLQGKLLQTIELSPLGSRDPEGITYDPERDSLIIADGRAQQVIELGVDGDHRSTWSFKDYGIRDAEGIVYDPESNHLFLASGKGGILFEVSQDGELLASYDLTALGAMRPQGITLAPTSDSTDSPAKMSFYIADGMIGEHPDGRILELALVRRPNEGQMVTSLLGDVDGFGFRGNEPGFAASDLDHNGVLAPGEWIPSNVFRSEDPPDNRDPMEHAATDSMLVIDESKPLRFRHEFDLEGRTPVWARITLVAGDARATGGSRNSIKVGDRVIGEVIGSRSKQLKVGPIAETVLELPPDALEHLRNGKLEVEISRSPGTGKDNLMIDFMRLDIATIN